MKRFVGPKNVWSVMKLQVKTFFKGVVRSKISRGYVKVDGLGETLLFSRTKSDKS